jgi:hypothetical protein
MTTPDAPEPTPRRKRKFALLWWVVSGLVVVALGWALVSKYQAYLNEEPVSKVPVIGEGGVTVRETAACNDALPKEKRSEVQQVSRDREPLVVQVLANASCGRRQAVSPTAKVDGNTVTLAWSWEVHGVPAACVCTHHLEFRIPGVPTGELSVRTAPPDH